MQIRLLGPMEVWQSGEPLALGGPKQRAVLAMLALNANRPVSLPAILHGLWGETASAGGTNAVQGYISRLRKVLEPAATGVDEAPVRRRGSGYFLQLAADRIDVNRFEELAGSGSRQLISAPRAAAATLREALDLWRGRALLEFSGMPFAEPETARLDEMRLAAVIGRIDADLALGRHADLLAELELLTAQHPLHEQLHRQFILALYRSGRQADALDTYRQVRGRLAADLGRAPDPALAALERAVLAQDEQLDWHDVPDARPRIPVQSAVIAPIESVNRRGATTRRRPDVWNVPPRNPHFTGRDSVLRAVEDRLGEGARTLVVQALYGLGGVGKSQLAIEFAHRHADRYALVWWVDAERPMLIGDQIARLAPPLGLPRSASAQETAHLVLADLAGRADWLLIFDNAERAADVAEYRPSGPGHILITSRTPGWGELGSRIPVDVLDRAETVGLFRSRLPGIDDRVAADLAAELGDLPLAVAQAVAQIEQSGMDPADYLRQFSTRRSAFLARGEVLGYQGRVDTAWDMSLQRLRGSAPTALRLLTHSAFLGPDPIPRNLFADRLPAADGHGTADTFELTDAIGAAAALSLLRRTPNGFQLHRLVQEVIRSHLPPDERRRVRNEVVDMLAAAHPGDPTDPAGWPGYAALVPHLFAVGAAADRHPVARRLLMDTLAYFNMITDTHAARGVAAAVHGRWRKVLGPDHPDTLTLAAYLTMAMMWDSAAREAGALGADSLARAIRTRGPDDPLSLRLAAYLSCTRAWLADADGARTLARGTLDRLNRGFGAEDPDALRLTGYLALALVWTGDPGAVEVASRTRDRARELLGPNHPTTLLAGADMSIGLLTDQDVDRTHAVALDTLTRARRVLGERHLITLAAASVLVMARLWQGDRAGAEGVDTELLAAADGFLDPDHVVALTTTAARTAVRADRSAGSGQSGLRAAVGRARRLLGPEHPITLIIEVGAAGSAESPTADLRGRLARVFGDEHPIRSAPPAPPT